MKPKHLTLVFLHGFWICAGLALAAASVASCTYTLPSADGSAAAGGTGGSGGAGGDGLCSTGLTDCKGTCVNTASDPANCGACDAACAPGFLCANSQCFNPNPLCTPGAIVNCYEGRAGTENVGTCHGGTQTCLDDGAGFGPCMGQVLPMRDDCSNNLDEDCNGLVATQGAECLTKEGLVVRYVLNEAASGTGPMMAMDSADNPLNLTVDYGMAGNMYYTETPTGRGLQWLLQGSSGTASALIDGTKVYNALHGATQATIEIVGQFIDANGSGSRIFSIGMGTEGGRFTFGANSVNGFQFRWLDVIAGDWPLSFSNAGRCVLHLVVDTTDPADANRIRLYFNGEPVMGNSVIGPVQNTLIDIGPGRSLYLGNREEGIRSFAGSLYYAALYNRPLAELEIKTHAKYLLAYDDQ